MSQRLRDTVAMALGLGAGIYAGRVGLLGLKLSQLMIFGYASDPWRNPAELGLPSEQVSFPSRDGLRLQGWFIPREGADNTAAPTIAFVHGWPWNRNGNQGGIQPLQDARVDFLNPTQALHMAGFNTLLFDLRNHGRSDSRPPVTFGLNEAIDVAAALQYLRNRSDVAADKLGLIGYSMGANAILYSLPEQRDLRAAVLVQPVRAETFGQAFSSAVLGPTGPGLLSISELVYRALGGPELASIDPTASARRVGDTQLLFIQGSNDPWSAIADVRAMVQAAPGMARLIETPSTDRFTGYQYVEQHSDEIINFFRDAMK